MHSSDHMIIEALLQSLRANEEPWLVMVIGTVGSSPRPVGSLVAFRADGSQTGSISGGCVEEDLVARLLAGEFDSPQVHLSEYGVSAEDNEKWGLPCGGRLQLAIQKLQKADEQWLERAMACVSGREVLRRTVQLESGHSTVEETPSFVPLQQTENQLSHCFGPRQRLLLVGAGQLAASLSALALAMDYEVILTDSRDWALEQWQGPDVEKILGMPDDVVRARGNDAQCAVITLSHDPRVDDMALMEALESSAWYVGALGSVRTTEKRLARLSKLGLSGEALARLHAPVGLDIGSKTAMEIAIAIMAELTQIRRSSQTDNRGKSAHG